MCRGSGNNVKMGERDQSPASSCPSCRRAFTKDIGCAKLIADEGENPVNIHFSVDKAPDGTTGRHSDKSPSLTLWGESKKKNQTERCNLSICLGRMDYINVNIRQRDGGRLERVLCYALS